MSGLLSWIAARFSFRGRATRREFWLTIPAAQLLALAGFGVIALVHSALLRASGHSDITGAGIFTIVLVLMIILAVLYGWLGLAVAIRRTHDLGQSGRASLRLGVNIDAAFSRGTAGPNRYGPDPLEG